MAAKKPALGARMGLDTSGSFHMSLNGSLSGSFVANKSLNQSIKTPHRTPGKQSSKTPGGSGKPKASSSKSKTGKTAGGGDRFMAEKPNVDMAHYILNQQKPKDKDDKDTENSEPAKKNENPNYAKSITENVLGVSELSETRVLSFMKKPKTAPEGYQNALKVVYLGNPATQPQAVSNYRLIPKSAERVLDAPDIIDDFYLNILEWSERNVVGIALRDQAYLWTAHTSQIARIPCDTEPGMLAVCGLTFLQGGNHVLTSLDTGITQIWDVERAKILRNIRPDEQHARVAALHSHAHMLTTGNRLGTLRFHDLRVQKHEVAAIRLAHTQEICGVKWSPDGRFCATGGNDNTVNVWDAANLSNQASPVCTFTDHFAAIKALCWSPSHQNVLATGGGTNDRHIKIWNISTSRLLKSVDTESQVSGLLWQEGYREIISSHGYANHHISVWKYPDMTKVGDMMGHSMRILGISLSPDETTVVSVSADETLRFWRVFPPTKATSKAKHSAKPTGLAISLSSLR